MIHPTHEQRELYHLLSERYYVLTRRKENGFQAKAAALKAVLAGIYPEAKTYVLYSLLSDTPPSPGGGPFDFPEPHSIEQFINGEYTRAFPEHALFAFLSDSKMPAGFSVDSLPEELKRCMDEPYEPTAAEAPAAPLGGLQPSGESANPGLEWLERPLQLETPTALPRSKKVTIPPGEHPFHAIVKEKPAPPREKGLKRWLKKCLRENRGNRDGR